MHSFPFVKEISSANKFDESHIIFRGLLSKTRHKIKSKYSYLRKRRSFIYFSKIILKLLVFRIRKSKL